MQILNELTKWLPTAGEFSKHLVCLGLIAFCYGKMWQVWYWLRDLLNSERVPKKLGSGRRIFIEALMCIIFWSIYWLDVYVLGKDRSSYGFDGYT